MGNRLDEVRPQRVLFGTGRGAEMLAAALRDLGASRPMVIATRGEIRRSSDVLDSIRPTLFFDDVRQHVPVEIAARARQRAADVGIDVLIAVGGGSAIGLAKAVALTSGLPIVAIPTTYAGSETTAMWGLVDGGVKSTGSDPRVLPGTIVYDARLTLSLPRGLSVSSGLNAIAHGVDSLWAPGATDSSRSVAGKSIRILGDSLPRIATDPASLLDRENMLHGAYLAARAFSQAGSGLHHKICHVLGGTFGLPHSETHAVMLPHVVAFNGSSAPVREATIAHALRAQSAVGGLLSLRSRLGAPTALRTLGFEETDIAHARNLILPAVPTSNPRPVTSLALDAMLHAAWAGTDPAQD